jgi:hypothetical protein
MNALIEKQEEFNGWRNDSLYCAIVTTNSNFHRGDAARQTQKSYTLHSTNNICLHGETENHRRMVFPFVFLHNGDMRSGLVLLPLQLSVNFFSS